MIHHACRGVPGVALCSVLLLLTTMIDYVLRWLAHQADLLELLEQVLGPAS